MQDIQHYYDMFERVIQTLGVDPKDCRGKEAGQWDLQKGSVPVWIDIYTTENGQYGYIQILSPIFEIPQNQKEAMFTEALEINHNLVGCSITKFNDWLFVKSIRELENIDEGEMMAMMNRVGTYADKYDDYFKSKYSAEGNRLL